MPKRKRRFLVGYAGDGQCVYGRESCGQVKYAIPTTIFGANQYAKKNLTSWNTRRKHPVFIYELVPVRRVK